MIVERWLEFMYALLVYTNYLSVNKTTKDTPLTASMVKNIMHVIVSTAKSVIPTDL